MKIMLIDFGYVHEPTRSHFNDAGADVYSPVDIEVPALTTVKVPLGFGIALPDGLVGFIFPRSSLSSKGITCELPPIDAGYRGEIHAVVSNVGRESYTISRGDRIGQLVITPVVYAEFVPELNNNRGDMGFGSTGR